MKKGTTTAMLLLMLCSALKVFSVIALSAYSLRSHKFEHIARQ